MTLTLYVPAPSSRLHWSLDPGSAIVGQETAEGRIMICYEGNRYGFMRDWDEMVLHAADRLITNYPTVARACVRPSDLVPVGTVDEATRTVVDVHDPDALRAWRLTASAATR